MEVAPLTLAHAHARNAAAETQKSNSALAKEEHEHAAGEFATAARTTRDAEAGRILSLLEDHHHLLARIIHQQEQAPRRTSPDSSEKYAPAQPDVTPSPDATAPLEAGGPVQDGAVPAETPKPRSPPGAARRKPARETSGIANELANARGIPTTTGTRRGMPASPATTAQTVGGMISRERERLAGRAEEHAPRTPRSKGDATTATSALQPITARTDASPLPAARPQAGTSARSDEHFNRFFSTFEALFSAISAPLAFAGLPLTTDEPPSTRHATSEKPPRASSPPSTTVSTRQQQQHPARTQASSPDLTNLFSKAALRALRDEQRLHGGGGGATESFFVVPSTGHTVSYANILARDAAGAVATTSAAGALATDGSAGDPDAEADPDDHFVDASETPAPPSPTQTTTRRPARAHRKTREELELEAATLRQLLDAQSRRLQLWEASAQSQSQALAASLRARSPAATSAHASSTAGASAAAAAPPAARKDEGKGNEGGEDGPRLRELEDALREERQERERLGRENEKLRSVVGRYRERWQSLVAGAKKLRSGERAGTAAGGVGETEPEPESGVAAGE